MSTPVHGRYVVLELWITDSYFPVLCGTDCTLTVEQEVILKTGPNSGRWRERTSRLSEWSASVSGLTMIENSVDSLTFFYMLQSAVRTAPQTIRITFEDEDGNGKQVSGTAIIQTEEINGPISDFSNATITLLGSGELVPGATIDPPTETVTVLSDYWDAVNGNNYVEGASTVYTYTLTTTDTLLWVGVEGVQFNVVSGTPGNRECSFDSGTGRITFESGLIFTGVERVFVVFKRNL